MVIRELLVKFGLHISDSDFKKADRALDRLSGSVNVLGGLLAGGLVATGFTKMITMASDGAETLNVLNAAFGKNLNAVLEWSSKTGKEVGRSKYAMRQYASQLGAVLDPMLGNKDKAAELSTTLSKLAVDLGSFFNTSDKDALVALRSGMVGEAEPLKRYGVVLLESTMKEYARAAGIKKAWKEMTNAEKVMLRYKYIMSVTKNAQGDAARTAHGFANKSKALKGALVDLVTEGGMKVLPWVTSFMHWGLESTRMLGKWTKKSAAFETVTLLAVSAVGLLGIAAGIYGVLKMGTFAVALGKAIFATQLFGNTALATNLKLFFWGAVILIIIGLIALLTEDLIVFSRGGQSLIGHLLNKWVEWTDQLKATGIDPDAHWVTQLLQHFILEIVAFQDKWMEAQDWWTDENSSLIGEIKMLWQDWITEPIRMWKEELKAFFAWVTRVSELTPLGMVLKGLDMAKALGGNATKSGNMQMLHAFAPGAAAVHPAAVSNLTTTTYSNRKASTVVKQNAKVSITVQQQPGQSGEDLAKKIRTEVQKEMGKQIDDAMAANTPDVNDEDLVGGS